MELHHKGTRDLNRKEIAIAQQVFLHTVPLHRVRVTDALGLRDRPYTLCYAAFDDGEPSYKMNVGAEGFAGMEASAYWRNTLVHELTHVWQACHSIWAPSYIFNSAFHQLVEGDAAYSYEAGAQWDKYNVEQQAHIVEDWYARGREETSVLYPYIRDKIRCPHASP